MTKPIDSAISRRTFIQRTGVTVAAVAAPMIIPARLLGANAPSNRVRVGHIGAGRIAQGHDMVGVAGSDLADVLAVADLDSRRAASGKTRVERLFAARNAPPQKIDVYTDYKQLLARSDIDAVTISLPDHQHAEVALRALRAGKDVYLQKPFTMTHAEGVMLRDAVAKSGRILQVGSQQRSWGPNEQFRKAVEFVRSGRVGQLQRNENYSLGMITGWGAHHFDTAHWGMNTELTGPSKIEGRGEFPPHDRIWNVHGKYHIELTYPGNVIMTVSDELPNGIKFVGTDGWIFVSRDASQTASDPSGRTTSLKSLDASDPKLLDPNGVTVQMPHSLSHHKNWLECVKSRATPLAPAPIAHRANAACIVSWIAMKLQRPLTWDAKAERFVNDAEANAMLTRPERAGYGALTLARTFSKV